MFFLYLVLCLLGYISSLILMFDLPNIVYNTPQKFKKLSKAAKIALLVISLLLTIIMGIVAITYVENFSIKLVVNFVCGALLSLAFIYFLNALVIFTKLNYSEIKPISFFIKELFLYILITICLCFLVPNIIAKLVITVIIALLVTMRMINIIKKTKND